MTKADKQAKEIAELKKEVAELKAAQPKPAASRPLTKEEQIAWHNEMDALRHRNESFVPPWLREACAGGVRGSDARAIAGAARAPQGPTTMAPSSPPVVRSGGGNVPGGGDAADARDKAERIREQRLEVLAKLAEQADQPKVKGKP